MELPDLKAPTVKHSSGRMCAFNNPGLGGDEGSLRLQRPEVRVRGRQKAEASSSRRERVNSIHRTKTPKAASPFPECSGAWFVMGPCSGVDQVTGETDSGGLSLVVPIVPSN